jgi:hypothetical protein
VAADGFGRFAARHEPAHNQVRVWIACLREIVEPTNLRPPETRH